MSLRRQENWHDSLQAIRTRKDNLRFEKFKQEEEERRLKDIEYYEYKKKVQ